MANNKLNIKRFLALLMTMVMLFNGFQISAQAAGGGHGPNQGGPNQGGEHEQTDSETMTLYWCYDVVSTEGDASKDLSLATLTFDGTAWAFGSAMTLSESAEVVVTPVAGYRVVQIDMLCTGGQNQDDPYDCRTYNEGASYTVAAAAGSTVVTITDFDADTACDHSSDSTKYYIMVTLEEVDVEETYILTYTPGEGVGTDYVDDNDGAGYAFAESHEILSIAHPNIGFTYEGHTFTGWKVIECTDESQIYSLIGNVYQGGEEFIMPAGNVTLEAQWEPVVIPEYPVTYSYVGEVPANAPAVPNGYQYQAGAEVNVHAAPSADGYIFSGWSTDDAQIIDGAFTMPEKAVVLVGSWEKVPTYTVTYIYEGEIPANAPALPVDGNAYYAGDAVTVAAEPTLEGYTFSGWDKTDFEMPAEDVTICGSWEKIPTYTVTYIYEGEIPANAPALPVDGNAYYAGDAVTVAAEPTLEGYTFSGWDKTDFEMPAEDVVIYGSWTENAKYDYSLTYNANFGGNETKADSENATGVYAAAWNIEVDANTFVRENYTFIGWNTEADGSGKAYAAGAVVALTAENNTEILYAQWKENEPPVTEPPVTEPPVTEPPVTEPPVTEPPVTEPPVTEPPVTEPPVTEPPVTEPPVTEPPVTEPPVTEPPVTEPPVTEPPVTEPPVTEPPVTEPPATEPPVTEIPEEPVPAGEPPVTEPEEEIEIEDEAVPLADLPKTGDPIFVFIGTAAASAGGMVGLVLRKKKQDEEE